MGIKPKYIFLLGGHDLEMLTIKEMLELHKYNFFDYDLSWGAKLSAYAAVLNNDDHFVAIELIEDISPPKYYTLLDHHNEFSHRKSSIEQVADLIGISLNREQELVAANDSGYIPALIAKGANNDEIARIRKQDRQAQGVTEIDESLAVESISRNLTTYNGITVVQSLTPRFSAVVDRLFPFRSLIIYNDSTLNYYGDNMLKLADHWRELIQEKKAYHGGGPHGYFGVGKDVLDSDGIIEMKNQIIELLAKKQ